MSPRFVVYIRSYLMDCGVDPEPVFTKVGIPSGNEEEYVYPIPVHEVAALCEAAVTQTGNTSVGLSMARQYHYETAPLIILAMLAASSVEEGLKCLCRYDQYVDTGIETEFNFDQSTARFCARLINPTHARVDQLNEYLLAFVVHTLSMATRSRMPVERVCFMHGNEQNRRELEAFFEAPVEFGKADNILFFGSAFLQEHFFSTNNLLYDILVDALKTYYGAESEKQGFIDAVCREILRLSSSDSPSVEAVARSLAISPRTLRRRLAEKGISFQAVKSIARERRAKYYLTHTTLSLSEIAFELGYSELSAFSRAFRAWVGRTPQDYRDHFQQLQGS